MNAVLRKMLFVDLIKGLKVTFRNQDPKNVYTEQYPLQRPQVAERYRGAPRLNDQSRDQRNVVHSCDLCALACPEHLIVVNSERNPHTRRKELTFHLRPQPLHVLRTLRRCLSDRRAGVDPGFRDGELQQGRLIWDRETLKKGPEPNEYRR